MLWYAYFYLIYSVIERPQAFIKQIIIESDESEPVMCELTTNMNRPRRNPVINNDVVNDKRNCYVVSLKGSFNISSFPGLEINLKYTKYMNGFSFCTSNNQLLKRLESHPSILHVEEDSIYHTAATQIKIPDHMFYISNFGNAVFGNYLFSNTIMDYLPLRSIYKFFFSYYSYKYTGRNVLIYLVDTTVNTASDDISGRVFNMYNKSSCNPHGTNVATLISGKKNSFAKNAIVNVLNVLDCEGKANLSQILGALEQVKPNSLLCLPVTGPKSIILNTFINRMSKNIIIVTAAGNNSDLGCNYSPGSAEGVINVGSVDMHANISTFSNFNSCINIYSLGEGLNFNSLRNIQGTSFSAALITSSIAIYLESNPKATFSDVWKYLVANSYRQSNSFFVQKIPSEKSLEQSTVNIYLNDTDDWFNFGLILWYLVIFSSLLFVIFYFFRRRRKTDEELVI